MPTRPTTPHAKTRDTQPDPLAVTHNHSDLLTVQVTDAPTGTHDAVTVTTRTTTRRGLRWHATGTITTTAAHHTFRETAWTRQTAEQRITEHLDALTAEFRALDAEQAAAMHVTIHRALALILRDRLTPERIVVAPDVHAALLRELGLPAEPPKPGDRLYALPLDVDPALPVRTWHIDTASDYGDDL